MNRVISSAITWMIALVIYLGVAILTIPTVHADTNEFLETASQLIAGIPNLHLFMFVGGLVACIVGLVIIRIAISRKNNYYDDDEY